MTLKPWWEEQPERLQWEYDWLEYEGYTFREISRDPSTGSLEILVEYPPGGRALSPPMTGKTLSLQVIFPPFFPEARYEVRCAEVSLVHHQNPFTKELCLLGRSTSLWDPNLSLAAFLNDQMPQVLEAGTTEDVSVAAPIEEHQAEPNAAYLQYLAESELLIDETVETVSQSGQFTAELGIGAVGQDIWVKGIITSIDGKPTWKPEPESVRRGTGWNTQIAGRWFRLTAFPVGRDAGAFFQAAQQEHPELAQPKPAFEFSYNNYRCELIAFEVPTEVAHRKLGTEWVILLRSTPKFGAKQSRVSRYGFVRLERFGRKLLYQRAPELSPLADKRIAVVGLGCVGAPAALEFARAAVGELRMLDMDIVEAGTVIRWPIGMPAVGSLKVGTLGWFLRQNFPLTKTSMSVGKIGGIVASGGITLDNMREFLNGVDLVVDASAEVGVSRTLSHLVGDLGTPLISIASTNGGWGGSIVTYEPGKSGCYDCFLRFVDEGVIPVPPQSSTDKVQPAGCSEPTYLAANFDTAEVTLAAVRTGVSILCSGRKNAYPELQRGVAILRLRDEDGVAVYPSWTRYQLHIHPKCTRH